MKPDDAGALRLFEMTGDGIPYHLFQLFEGVRFCENRMIQSSCDGLRRTTIPFVGSGSKTKGFEKSRSWVTRVHFSLRQMSYMALSVAPATFSLKTVSEKTGTRLGNCSNFLCCCFYYYFQADIAPPGGGGGEVLTDPRRFGRRLTRSVL